MSRTHVRPRHELVRLMREVPASSATLDDVRALVQDAIQVEHFTIPPYLTALYSIAPGTNSDATELIRTVVVEEMLHMISMCNLLNALDADPDLTHPGFVGPYPSPLPYSVGDFTVPISRFSPDTVTTFTQIERPAGPFAPPEGVGYHTIGQFYAYIAEALQALEQASPGKVFTGDPARQIRPERYYNSGGVLITVTDLASALEAIAIVVSQGEGLEGRVDDGEQQFGEPDMLAHYYRFMSILWGREYAVTDDPAKPPTGPEIAVDWTAVVPMVDDPSLAMFASNLPLYEQALAFSARFAIALEAIEAAVRGQPALLTDAMALMFQLRSSATALLRVPFGDGGQVAGPTWEIPGS